MSYQPEKTSCLESENTKMPSKKKKYNARFPPARIKKIMQTDEDVGKVAAAVPVIISRALELFIESLILKTSETTRSRNAKTLSPQHIKQTILGEKNFDFLKDLVASVPDVLQGDDEEGGSGGKGAGDNSAPKPRGRPRKNKDKESKTPKKKGRPRKKKESSEDSATESASQEEEEEGGSDDATEEDENTDEEEEEEDHVDSGIPTPAAEASAAPPSWNGHPAGVHEMHDNPMPGSMPGSMAGSMPSTSGASHGPGHGSGLPYPPPGYLPPMTYPTGPPPPAHVGYSHAMGPPPMSYPYQHPPPAHMSHLNMHSGSPSYGQPNPSSSYMPPLPSHHVMSSSQPPNYDS